MITVEETDEDRARALVEDMAHQLLANAVIEDFRVELQQESASPLVAEGRAAELHS